MRLYLLLLIGLLCTDILAQEAGYEIKIQIEGYEEKELYLANHYGDNQYLQDTATVNASGEFIFQGTTALPGGIYLLAMAPAMDLIQILIDQDQHFAVQTSAITPAQSMQITGSTLNTDFYTYLNFLGESQVLSDEYSAGLTVAKEAGDDIQFNDFADKLDAVNNSVTNFQKQLLAEQGDSFLGKIIKANLQPELPSFEDSEDPEYDQYIYVKEHWFDNIDLGDSLFLRTPILSEKVDYYMQKLTFQIPDSLITAVDYILEKLKPAAESHQYYLIHFLNKYGTANIVGMDAVYVHIGEKYFSAEQTPWADSSQLAKIESNVKIFKPLLIGKSAPDLKLQIIDIDKTIAQEANEDEFKRFASAGDFTLKSLDADYTVLFIWAPNCNHCKESLPFLVDFYEKWKDSGVEIVALCNSIYKKMPECAKYLKEKGMINWVNAMDPFVKSKYKKLYDVRTTPQLYVIDRAGNIVTKKVQTEDLDQVMENIIQLQN